MPDFFIVGAPRSGTSFLYMALRRHPAVFMPYPKEPLHFCTDLNTGTAADRREFVLGDDDYLELFRPAPVGALIGEACVFNLFSAVAAQGIHAARPDAKIFICLREPVDQMVSFHAVRVAEGQEDLPFEQALAAEADRRAGRRLPLNAVLVPAYQYRSMASYAAQVERYLERFPRDQVLILLHDDLRRDPEDWLSRAATFLGLPEPRLSDPGVVNAQFESRWALLTRATRSRSLIAAAKRVVPRALHPHGRRAAQALGRLNRRRIAPARIDPALHARLRAELRPDVERLERLIGQGLVARWQ